MQRAKTATAVTSLPAYSESGTPGYFTSGDAVAGTPATVPGQDWFNMVQEELLNVIKAAGLAPSATDDSQLRQAITALIADKAVAFATLAQAIAGTDNATAMTPAKVAAALLLGTGRVAVAGGVADALTVTVPSELAALVHGMTMIVRAAAANESTTPTIDVTLGETATDAKTIYGPGGTVLWAGAISGPGHWLHMVYDAVLGGFVLLNPYSEASTTDQVARDQIALTNLRQLINTAVTTGALIQGKQWELSTDEWASTSTDETYVSGSPGYYTGLKETTVGNSLIQRSTYLTAGYTYMDKNSSITVAGKVKAFKVYSDSAVTARMCVFRLVSGSIFQLVGESQDVTLTAGGITTITPSSEIDVQVGDYLGIYAQGNVTGNCGGTGALLAYASAHSSANMTFGQTSNLTSSLGAVISSGSKDITLIPPSLVSLSEVPAYADLYSLWKDDSGGSAVLGTDFTVELSRDAGTTWTTATLTNMVSLDGAYGVIKARADLSSQPSGTSLTCRIKHKNYTQRTAAPALYAE